MRQTVYSIQAMRAVAAMMVVVYHAQAAVRKYESAMSLAPTVFNSTRPLQTLGSAGVDIFFVISGFVMAYITCNRRGTFSYAVPFIKRRLTRIVPVYWIYTTLWIILLIALPHLFNVARFNPEHTIFSYLFIPYNAHPGNPFPVLQVGWTLYYEMYFYVLVAAGFIFSQRQFVVALGVFFMISVFLLPMLNISGKGFEIITNPILFEFYAGFAFGAYHSAGRGAHPIIPPLLLASGVVGFVLWAAGLTTIHRGLFAVLLVCGAVLCERQFRYPCPQWMVAIGDSSYTLYLSHHILLPGLFKLCAMIGLWRVISPSVFIVSATVACVIAAHVLYLLIEKPVIARLSKAVR